MLCPSVKSRVLYFWKSTCPSLMNAGLPRLKARSSSKYPGLLDLAHQHGLSSIEVDIVQMPTKENGNFAVCRATVMSKIGETFTDIGDANPGNCSSKVAKHLLRMASTRSIARALRSYTNVGMTALEELADFNDAIPEAGQTPQPIRPKTKPKVAKKPAAKAPKQAPAKTSKTDTPANAVVQEPKTEPEDQSGILIIATYDVRSTETGHLQSFQTPGDICRTIGADGHRCLWMWT